MLTIGVILGQYWGYMLIMENEMETTAMGSFWGLESRADAESARWVASCLFVVRTACCLGHHNGY